jgi:hypothetical protein
VTLASLARFFTFSAAFRALAFEENDSPDVAIVWPLVDTSFQR